MDVYQTLRADQDGSLFRKSCTGVTRPARPSWPPFDRVVATHKSELLLLSGYAGIGESSVVRELHKVIVLPRGIFISGKFDQHRRDIPYATLAQAFRDLARQILSKSEEEIIHWRHTILEGLGPNGQLMVNLVPELELVIGKQPPVPELATQEAQHRFEAVLRAQRHLCIGGMLIEKMTPER